jgi:hypothetical protein
LKLGKNAALLTMRDSVTSRANRGKAVLSIWYLAKPFALPLGHPKAQNHFILCRGRTISIAAFESRSGCQRADGKTCSAQYLAARELALLARSEQRWASAG